MHIEDTSPVEEWREVEGYESLYSVSNYGRVRRDKRWKNSSPDGMLSQAVTGRYLCVCLARDCGKKRWAVHRLVAHAFIGPCPEGLERNHKDGDKFNNTAWNLEYVTRSENQKHAWRLKLAKPRRAGTWPRGEKNGMSKLTEEIVRQIRAEYVPRKTPQRMLARRYGVSQGVIWHALHGRNWKYLDGAIPMRSRQGH